MNSLNRAAALALTSPLTQAATRRGSHFDRPGAKGAAGASVMSLRAIAAWLLAAFIGTSLVASSLARLFDAGSGTGAGAALCFVAGAALAWIASRRLASLERGAEFASESGELQ